MSRTIHGKSHEALKAFRKKSAALAVYWVYVSRMNNEGVTWPSVAKIASDTGWSKDTCHDARTYLVSVNALERVDGYVRPAWRELKPQDRTRKVNLDKSEYYRPTGFIMLNGKKLPLLYNGADEASAIDADTADEPSGIRQSLTSDESGHQPPSDIKDHRTVLDSNLVLDSIEEHAAVAAQAEPPLKVVQPDKPRDLIFDALALGSFGIAVGTKVSEETAARVGLLKKWLKKNYPGANELTVAAFYRWYDTSENGASRPRDVKKFASSFDKFHAAMEARKNASANQSAKMTDLMNMHAHDLAQREEKGA